MTGSGYRGRNTLKLLRRIDGPAVLIGEGGETAVHCSAGEYEERDRATVTGSLEGDVSGYGAGADVTLRFGDGSELSIRLIEPDEEGADFRSL